MSLDKEIEYTTTIHK